MKSECPQKKLRAYNLRSIVMRKWLQILVAVTYGLIAQTGMARVQYLTKPAKFEKVIYPNAGQFVIPSAADVASAGTVHEFNLPMKTVLRSMLDVVAQYPAILASEGDDMFHSLVVLKGTEAKIAPDNTLSEINFSEFYEQAIVIALTESDSLTTVSIAGIEPYRYRLIKSDDIANSLIAQVSAHLYGVPHWKEKFEYINWQSRPIRYSRILDYKKKISDSDLEAESNVGDWISKKLSFELCEVYCPSVTDSLESVVDRLKQTQGIETLDTKVKILASPQMNAFALPNGDIYVTSGLLDSLETIDEVAAVLAHELDHVARHDVIAKIRKENAGKAVGGTLRMVWGLTDLVLSAVGSGSTDIGSSIAKDVGRAIADDQINRQIHTFENTLFENYSAETELRADENGLRTLYAAGFSPNSSVEMLVRLQDSEREMLANNQIAMSNLLSMEPGLNERIDSLSRISDELKTNNLQVEIETTNP